MPARAHGTRTGRQGTHRRTASKPASLEAELATHGYFAAPGKPARFAPAPPRTSQAVWFAPVRIHPVPAPAAKASKITPRCAGKARNTVFKVVKPRHQHRPPRSAPPSKPPRAV